MATESKVRLMPVLAARCVLRLPGEIKPRAGIALSQLALALK